MSDKAIFLLIGTKTERPWTSCLQSALSDLGKLHVISEEKAFRTVSNCHHDLIFIDSNCVDNVSSLISRLISKRPQTRIIVFTASPVWHQAREALYAGAADYLHKILDEGKLRSEIMAVFNHPPPYGRISKENRRW